MIRSGTAAGSGGTFALTFAPSWLLHRLARRYMAPVCLLLLMGGGFPAGHAAAAKADATEKPAKAKSKALKLKLPTDSSESRADRIARLKRECRGGVNAGACEGYTR